VKDQSLALLTDLYQLTMVYGYWKAGMHNRQAVFHINYRRKPFKGSFAIAAGLETAIEFLQNLHFSSSDLAFLEKLGIFERPFLDFLSHFSFACDISAMPEGTLVFPYEPFFRVKGPLWQAQLLESPMLNLLNFQTLIATKAARICAAAFPDPVIEFGMRRAQGIDGAISASRAAYIGGCAGTSDVIAGKLFDIPVKGTQAHSWIMAFDGEEEAFETFAKVMPKQSVLLIDTYHSIVGAKRAISVATRLKKNGFHLSGVRLDSGNLAHLSIEVRKLLDAAGFFDTQIMASNELDEYLIRDLKDQGAKISMWGVGTNLVTAKDQPALDGVYKLSAIQNEKGEWVHKLKLSDAVDKVTNPGILQVKRFFDGKHYVRDLIYDELLGVQEDQFAKDLLVPIFKGGKLVYKSPSIHKMQLHAKSELSRLPDVKSFPVELESSLEKKKQQIIKALHENTHHH
jgi:nicotinate phosphoribosyltransferase